MRMVCGLVAGMVMVGPVWAGGLSLAAPATGDTPVVPDLDRVDAALARQRATSQIAVTLYFENDGSWARPNGTDRWYTSGEGLSIASEGGWADLIGPRVPSFGDEFAPERATYAVGFVGSQEIYTPNTYLTTTVDPNDHPYAGWTYGGLFFQRANAHAFEHLELDVGTTGEASLARRAQEMIHTAFGYDAPRGWSHQVHDEVGVDLTYRRAYRFDLWQGVAGSWGDGWQLQALPEVGLVLGTAHTRMEAAGTVRFGWHLPDDFGPGRLRYVQAYTGLHDAPDWSAYVFGSARGMLVWRDVTIEGDAFRDSPGATLTHQVGELSAGFSVIHFKHVQLTWALHYRTREFDPQPDNHMYGSWSVMFFWEW